MPSASQRYRVGRAADLQPGGHTVVRAGNRELGVFNIGGALHALPNLCPHQRGPLCSGGTSGTLDMGPDTGWKLAWRHEGEIVTCPWHGLEFHVPSGQCLAWPEIRLSTYAVSVVDGEIEIAL